jgi:hypothetical protein
MQIKQQWNRISAVNFRSAPAVVCRGRRHEKAPALPSGNVTKKPRAAHRQCLSVKPFAILQPIKRSRFRRALIVGTFFIAR